MLKHSSSGNSALHLACSRGFYDICKYLLAQYGKETPSDAMKGVAKIINDYNYDGKTPLLLAAEKGNINKMCDVTPTDKLKIRISK